MIVNINDYINENAKRKLKVSQLVILLSHFPHDAEVKVGAYYSNGELHIIEGMKDTTVMAEV